MSATLRTSTIRRRRDRHEKRRKLRRRLSHATAAERQVLEARLLKTYPLLTAQAQARTLAAARPGGPTSESRSR
jgi:hypothetical protein